jgi:NADPH:quinone reductase-like Zn-dependent oxidoreductase
VEIPETMSALVQQTSGFATEPRSSSIPESLDPLLAVETIPVPQPGSGEVMIRVHMAPVNPSDVSFIAGFYGQPRVAGKPAGFEGVGEVVASGGGPVANRLVGKRASFFADVSGSWAEYAVAGAGMCIPLRAGIRDADGAALLVNPFSAWAMQDIVLREGPKAFVMTAGGSQLCKLLTALAKDEGFRPISLVRRDEQIEPLKRLGATHVLNTEAPDFAASLREVLKAEKPRVLFDAVTGKVPKSVFLAMGKRSRWIVYGGLDAHPASLPDPGQLIFQSKQIEGFWLTSWLQRGSGDRMARAARGVQDRFASGAWTTDVAVELPLAEAHARVPELLAGPNHGKIMLTP